MTLPKFSDYLLARNGKELPLSDELAGTLAGVEQEAPATVKLKDGSEITNAVVLPGGSSLRVYSNVDADAIASVTVNAPAGASEDGGAAPSGGEQAAASGEA